MGNLIKNTTHQNARKESIVSQERASAQMIWYKHQFAKMSLMNLIEIHQAHLGKL